MKNYSMDSQEFIQTIEFLTDCDFNDSVMWPSKYTIKTDKNDYVIELDPKIWHCASVVVEFLGSDFKSGNAQDFIGSQLLKIVVNLFQLNSDKNFETHFKKILRQYRDFSISKFETANGNFYIQVLMMRSSQWHEMKCIAKPIHCVEMSKREYIKSVNFNSDNHPFSDSFSKTNRNTCTIKTNFKTYFIRMIRKNWFESMEMFAVDENFKKLEASVLIGMQVFTVSNDLDEMLRNEKFLNFYGTNDDNFNHAILFIKLETAKGEFYIVGCNDKSCYYATEIEYTVEPIESRKINRFDFSSDAP